MRKLFRPIVRVNDSFSEVVAVARSDLLRCLIRRLYSDFAVSLIFKFVFFSLLFLS